MQFKIEQIALGALYNTAEAHELLAAMGLTDWSRDRVAASGLVRGEPGGNVANLSFNYQASSDKPLELELLQYVLGPNWISEQPPCVTHLGMHVTQEELAEWDDFFASRGIAVAQRVNTQHHTNPVIAGKRQYTYVIYDTRAILGTDIKLIVRRDVGDAAAGQ